MIAVRTFEGNQSLQFKVFPLDKDETGAEWQYEYSYTLDDIVNPNPEHSWQVNAITGEVFNADYYNLVPSVRYETP